MRTHDYREGSTMHWCLSGKIGEEQQGWELGRNSMEEMPNVSEGKEGSKTHCHVSTYATILQVLQCTSKHKV